MTTRIVLKGKLETLWDITTNKNFGVIHRSDKLEQVRFTIGDKTYLLSIHEDTVDIRLETFNKGMNRDFAGFYARPSKDAWSHRRSGKLQPIEGKETKNLFFDGVEFIQVTRK